MRALPDCRPAHSAIYQNRARARPFTRPASPRSALSRSVQILRIFTPICFPIPNRPQFRNQSMRLAHITPKLSIQIFFAADIYRKLPIVTGQISRTAKSTPLRNRMAARPDRRAGGDMGDELTSFRADARLIIPVTPHQYLLQKEAHHVEGPNWGSLIHAVWCPRGGAAPPTSRSFRRPHCALCSSMGVLMDIATYMAPRPT